MNNKQVQVEMLAILVKKAAAAVDEAEKYADEHGLCFSLDLGHGENYIPKEAAEKMNQDNRWNIVYPGWQNSSDSC